MIRLVLFVSIFFLISYGIGGEPALCEEKCPLEVIDWEPKGTIDYNFPTISATFRSACGAKIDLSSIQMFMGDSSFDFEVEAIDSEVTISHIIDLELEMDNRYVIRVRATDVNGEEAEMSWRFYLPFHY